ADEALTKAWESDHNDAEAATEMISVELGQAKGRDRMELWYRRAMEADPDHKAACDAKMYYLQPKWHAQPKDMLTFADECYATHNWSSDLPFYRGTAITDLESYAQDANAFYASPGVWESLASVFEPWLRYKPANHLSRSRYC